MDGPMVRQFSRTRQRCVATSGWANRLKHLSGNPDPRPDTPGAQAPGDPRETTGSIGGAWTAGNRLERSRPNGQGGLGSARPGGGIFVVGAVGPGASHPSRKDRVLPDQAGPGRGGGPVAESAVAPPGPIPNPVVTRGSAGEYCGGDPVGGEAAAGPPPRRGPA